MTLELFASQEKHFVHGAMPWAQVAGFPESVRLPNGEVIQVDFKKCLGSNFLKMARDGLKDGYEPAIGRG